MNKEPMVSIVIAAYNAEKYLRTCLDSVLQQSFADYEIVLVNDGSTDRTGEIIHEYQTAHPSIFSVISKKNAGLSAARNDAIAAASGRYIAFLDADDYLEPHYLENLVTKAEQDNLDVVCSGEFKVSETGTIIKTIHYKVTNGKCLRLRLNISGKLYRRSYLNRYAVSFTVGKTYEDNPFNLQALFLTPRVGFLEYEGYYQVVHEGSITAGTIEASSFPFEALEEAAGKVLHEKIPGADMDLFAFTFLSLLSYILLIRGRKREYLSNEKGARTYDENVKEIASRMEKIVNQYFPQYNKNRYLSLFHYGSIPAWQKIGTRIFYNYCRKQRLYALAEMVYRLTGAAGKKNKTSEKEDAKP